MGMPLPFGCCGETSPDVVVKQQGVAKGYIGENKVYSRALSIQSPWRLVSFALTLLGGGIPLCAVRI